MTDVIPANIPAGAANAARDLPVDAGRTIVDVSTSLPFMHGPGHRPMT
jgi:hypothetical protein